MLDLDSLAHSRARSLNEKEEDWRQAIWSPDFQRISVNMSDGEVETLVTLCPSVRHFKDVVQLLEQKSKDQRISPFAVLTEEASRAGMSLNDWVKSVKGLL
jgi:hypothetical protein